MKLVLQRQYFSSGTNGVLSFNGKEICKTIELPWKNNQKRISCIPEGIYKIRKRFSLKFKWHNEIMNVKNRDYILFHQFFKKIRNIGLVLTAISGVIATAPISLPAVLVTVAGYLAVAGGIASAISQTAVYRDN